MNYSVLMSVYNKENPNFLRISIESIIAQTTPTNDFVIVCDGQLSNELNLVLEEFKTKYPEIINVTGYEENQGLGYALDFGLKKCKNEIILRADSDDFSKPNRAEIQLKRFIEDGVDISSCDIDLFDDDPYKPIGSRRLPLTEKEIRKFARTRSPFNHPSIIFKKSKVIEAGGYQTLLFKEDYYLWIRMLQKDVKCNNLSEHLVSMRINNNTFFKRRNKVVYKSSKWLNRYMRKTKFISFGTYLKNYIIYFFRQHLPSKISATIVRKIWKK